MKILKVMISYMISYMIYNIIYDIIHDIMSLLIVVSLQKQMSRQHRALRLAMMQSMTAREMLTEIWITTSSATVTAGELNAILDNNLIPSHGGKGQLRTFCCIQWEWECYSGRPKALCYPFNLKGHRFRRKNSQVLSNMLL